MQGCLPHQQCIHNFQACSKHLERVGYISWHKQKGGKGSNPGNSHIQTDQPIHPMHGHDKKNQDHCHKQACSCCYKEDPAGTFC